MNLTGSLQSVDLTTLARLKRTINATRSSGGADCNYEQMISDASARITNYLGFHTLKAARVETYELALADRMLTLDGRPVDLTETFEIRIGSSPVEADLSALDADAATSYRVAAPAGWIRFSTGTAISSPSWAQVTYTAGLGATAAAVTAAFPDIAHACELQVKYEAQRSHSLGGNVETGAGKSSFTGEYGLLREVQQVLDVHRRHYT